MPRRVIIPLLVTVVALVTVAVLDLAAQAPQLPPRDGAAVTQPRVGTASLHGRVVDAETKRPLRRAQITLTGTGLPPRGVPTSTDDEGRYEYLELPGGRYNLSVLRGGYLQLRYGQRRPGELGTPLDVREGQRLEGVDFALPRAAAIAGRVTDELGDPIAGVYVSAQRYIYSQEQRRLTPDAPLATTDDQGEYRIVGLMPGSYVVNARTLERWTVQTNGREDVMGYAPTFFPGTTDGGQATLLAVATGQQIWNIDFSLVPGRAAVVSGTALDSRGQPIRNVSLSFEIMGTGGGLTGVAGQATVGAEGRFSLPPVSPGEYQLRGTGTQESFSLPIVVTGPDITDIVVSTSAGWALRGAFVIESDTPAALKHTEVTVAPFSALGRTFTAGGVTQRQVVNDDWSFLVTGVVGPARLRVTLPEGWAVKALLAGDRDVADTRFDLASGQEMSGLRLVVTDRVATVTGQLAAPKADPGGGTVLLFATDANKWFDGSRFVRTARPDQQGRYRITGVLPGQYLAVALEYVEQGTWNDPAFLESIRRHAQPIAVERPEVHELPLRVVAP